VIAKDFMNDWLVRRRQRKTLTAVPRVGAAAAGGRERGLGDGLCPRRHRRFHAVAEKPQTYDPASLLSFWLSQSRTWRAMNVARAFGAMRIELLTRT
jgi:hypothetical protein